MIAQGHRQDGLRALADKARELAQQDATELVQRFGSLRVREIQPRCVNPNQRTAWDRKVPALSHKSERNYGRLLHQIQCGLGTAR